LEENGVKHEYVCDIWQSCYDHWTVHWTKWHFSHLKVFAAENAAKALEDAEKYVQEISCDICPKEVRNLRKI